MTRAIDKYSIGGVIGLADEQLAAVFSVPSPIPAPLVQGNALRVSGRLHTCGRFRGLEIKTSGLELEAVRFVV